MAKAIIRNAAIWLDGYDLQRGANRIDIEGSSDVIDVTCFADTSRVKVLDTPQASISAAGYMDSVFEKALFDSWGVQGLALTAAFKKLAGEIAFVADVQDGRYNTVLGRGQAMGFTLACEVGVGGFGRGRVLHVGSGVTATGTGTGQLMRAIGTGFKAVASLHVTSVAGTTPTLTVIIESDDNVGFTSPVTQATFTTTNVVDGETKAIVGPKPDTYWRAKWTITGTLPVFDFAVALGFEEGF